MVRSQTSRGSARFYGPRRDLWTEPKSAEDLGQLTQRRQTSQAIQDLDSATQGYPSLVEQTAATSAMLREQADRLSREVARFRLPDRLSLPASETSSAAGARPA